MPDFDPFPPVRAWQGRRSTPEEIPKHDGVLAQLTSFAWWFLTTPETRKFFGSVVVLANLMAVKWHFGRHGRTYASRWLHSWSMTTTPVSFLRSKFVQAPMPPARETPGHTHATAAAARNKASLFIELVCNTIGLRPLYYQCSASDQRLRRDGSRSYYWPKDLIVAPQPFVPDRDAAIAIVDVDHYLDMPTFLSENTNPILISTFQPTKCADVIDNFSYTFDKNSIVEYKVSGGGVYRHEVWNYAQDTITATRWFYFLPIGSTVYHVDRRTTSAHHEVVLLSPTARWGFFSTLVAMLTLAATPLKRLNLNRNNHNRLTVKTESGLYTSTSVPGQHACATVKTVTDDTIANLVRASRTAITRNAVESQLEEIPDRADRAAAATILFTYHIGACAPVTLSSTTNALITKFASPFLELTPPDVVFPNEPTIRGYQIGTWNEDATLLMRPFMSPLLNEAFAPYSTRDNEQAAIQGRIIDVHNDAEMTPFLLQCANEFAERFVGRHAATVVPVDYDEVEERQARPSQRAIIQEQSWWLRAKRIVKTFMKAEAYTGLKDPRIISTVNGKDKIDYARFSYAIAQYFKDHVEMYAFGKSPEEITTRVAEICVLARWMVETDFTRFDGSIGVPFRIMEVIVFMLLLHPDYKATFSELYEAHHHQIAVGTYGTVVETENTQLSGDMMTSLANTLRNMFVTFVAFRCTRVGGAYMDADSAWEETKKGIYGGDDGLTPNVSKPAYEKACAMLGLKAKIKVSQRGEMGVTFLARVYGPDVWTGDTSNCADLPRQLAKLHVCRPRPANVTPQQILTEKMLGYYMTDYNTPIVGEIARRAIGYQNMANFTTEETSYLALAEEFDISSHGEKFHNFERDWYQAYAEKALPNFDFEQFGNWLDGVDTLEKLLSPPLCQRPSNPEPHPRRDTHVDGRIIRAAATAPPRAATEQGRMNQRAVTWRQRQEERQRAAPQAQQRPRGPPPNRGPPRVARGNN